MASVTDETANPRWQTLYWGLKALRGSLLLSAVAAGFVLLLVAAVFESGLTITQNDGVLAGMLGVFGLSAIVTGGVGYALVRVLHRR
ncbi:hypothetical protein [Halosimplex amylolyticum]|uniref:hypothetical protein n=1 Tax=Halosimplex amylolyticum TaxID=3396616 RepID=UPI003F560A70